MVVAVGVSKVPGVSRAAFMEIPKAGPRGMHYPGGCKDDPSEDAQEEEEIERVKRRSFF